MDLHGTTLVKVGEKEIDFKRPWKRFTMFEAIQHFTGVDISQMDEVAMRDTCRKLHVPVDETMAKGKLIDAIFGEHCEPKLIQPTFITDYPVEMSPLAKKHRTKAGLVERFEAICNGKEICNAFSELNDPIDQRERFEDQMRLAAKGDDEANGIIDEDFLRALEYGMPPTSGMGIGMDSLIMYLTNNASIQEVLLFPQMRPEKKQAQVELSDEEKFIVDLLKGNENKMDRQQLKITANLSGKKWDASMKNFSKHGLTKVTVEGEFKFVELVE
jgi:lysyl-tRNA synthetase class 2